MGELRDDLHVWLEADVRPFPFPLPVFPIKTNIDQDTPQPAEDPTDDAYPHIYEQSLYKLACALGSRSVLPPAFQYIPMVPQIDEHLV